MSANHSSPLRGLVSGVALLVLGATLEYLFHWLVLPMVFIGLSVYLVVDRFVRWLGISDQETLEAVAAGLPFALILLIVFQLK
jgi:hypothetical protein